MTVLDHFVSSSGSRGEQFLVGDKNKPSSMRWELVH